MTLQDLEVQLLSLTPAEKLEVIQILSHSLSQNWRGITKTPGVCGGDACIEGTRFLCGCLCKLETWELAKHNSFTTIQPYLPLI